MKDFKMALEKYGFEDKLGHPLENCVDYQELLAAATQESYLSEAIRILEGATRGDSTKIHNYANLLIEKLETNGQTFQANCFRRVLEGNAGARIVPMESKNCPECGSQPLRLHAPGCQRAQDELSVESQERFCFVKDDDCHDYLIPADKYTEFKKWLEHQHALWDETHTDEEFKKLEAQYTGEDFNNYRTGVPISYYTFLSPIYPKEAE